MNIVYRKTKKRQVYYVLAALICGFISLIAFALIYWNAPSNSRAVLYTFNGNINDHIPFYFVFARGFAKTLSPVADPCIFENKNILGPRLLFGIVFFGFMNLLFSNPFIAFYIGSYILISLVFWFLIKISKMEFKKGIAGLFIGALVFINTTPSNLIQVLKMLLSGSFNISNLSKVGIVNEQYVLSRITATFYFFLVLYFYIKTYKKNKNDAINSFFFGILLGFSFYFHVYLGFVLIIIFGFLSLHCLFTKNKQYKFFRNSLFFSAIPAIPFFLYNIWHKLQPAYFDIIFRYDIQFARFVVLPPLIPTWLIGNPLILRE